MTVEEQTPRRCRWCGRYHHDHNLPYWVGGCRTVWAPSHADNQTLRDERKWMGTPRYADNQTHMDRER